MEAIHIVGAGGIGLALGYALARSGRAVTLVERCPQRVADARRQGVRVDRLPPQPVAVEWFADWSPPTHGIVFLCTKTYDNPAVLERIGPNVRLIPVQNGFDPRLDARDHAVEGIASFVSEATPGQAHTRITRGGKLYLGSRKGLPANGLHGLARDLVRARLFTVRRVAAIEPYKHTKLLYNAAIAPLAATAGLDNGDLLRLPVARRLFFAMLQENLTILRSAGKKLARIGPFHPYTVARILARPWLANLLAKGFSRSLRGTYCSMTLDLPRGQTEIDHYNGHLIRLAEAAGCPCPLNRRAVELVHHLSQHRLAPGQHWLEAWQAADAASPRVAVPSPAA